MTAKDTYADVISLEEVPTIEELVAALSLHRSEILEAKEWRPLAQHVRGLIRACLKGKQPANSLTDRQRSALSDLLTHIGSWTSARWDQHLRYGVGDDDANAIIQWLRSNGITPYVPDK